MKSILILALTFTLTLTCIDRSEAIGRAMEWVKDNVPYNANKYHDGYIQGCEGVVGYAWLFPKPGVYSGDLIPQGWCRKIGKDHLQKGDIFVCPGKHQLLFDGWASGQNYWGIELGGPRGTIRTQIPYPYHKELNPECYIPCQVAKSCYNYQQLLQKE